ncbi:MAG TPA: AbrB/MazE/SpoVT family DNA-binding domain-containing protein [Chitinophagaceae bacterium]|nr:AbrB/MazE/SpoVT family DNA-binding domain-containing protein [Chitinophagaceae bacterium]
MRTRLKKIGNSKGITFSKSLLEQYQLEDEVEIIPQPDGLLIMPAKASSREQWDEQFKSAKKTNQQPGAALLGSFSNSFDKKEWTW